MKIDTLLAVLTVGALLTVSLFFLWAALEEFFGDTTTDDFGDDFGDDNESDDV